jgi:hypothetical protein
LRTWHGVKGGLIGKCLLAALGVHFAGVVLDDRPRCEPRELRIVEAHIFLGLDRRLQLHHELGLPTLHLLDVSLLPIDVASDPRCALLVASCQLLSELLVLLPPHVDAPVDGRPDIVY